MEIRKLICNIFEENTYMMWDKRSREAAIVDPGMYRENERKALDDFIAAEKLDVKMILLTHAHLDHTFGLDHTKEVYGAEIIGHVADAPLLRDRQAQAKMFHLPYRLEPLELDRTVSDGEELMLGDQKIEVMNVPGHSKGSVAYYVPESKFVLTGDVLFKMGMGRTDLPGGSMSELLHSIRTKLLTLPADTVVYSGHGASTTIGEEAVRF